MHNCFPRRTILLSCDSLTEKDGQVSLRLASRVVGARYASNETLVGGRKQSFRVYEKGPLGKDKRMSEGCIMWLRGEGIRRDLNGAAKRRKGKGLLGINAGKFTGKVGSYGIHRV